MYFLLDKDVRKFLKGRMLLKIKSIKPEDQDDYEDKLKSSKFEIVFSGDVTVEFETWIELVKPKKKNELDKQHLRPRSYYTVKIYHLNTLIIGKENLIAKL
jgi:hypothetical protein